MPRPGSAPLPRLPGPGRKGLAAVVLAAAALVAASAPGAWAQEPSPPLHFEVRPSGVEPDTADDRLERRLRQREYLFRSICSHCGGADRFRSNAPFNPFEALRRPVPE